MVTIVLLNKKSVTQDELQQLDYVVNRHVGSLRQVVCKCNLSFTTCNANLVGIDVNNDTTSKDILNVHRVLYIVCARILFTILYK